MKRWFARFAAFCGFYDLVLCFVFVFATPLLSIFLAIPLNTLSATLLQVVGSLLLAFGIALVAASRDMERLLIVPVVDIPARLIAGASVVYHVVFWSLPSTLASFGISDIVLGFVMLAFILGIKEYGIRAAFSRRKT